MDYLCIKWRYNGVGVLVRKFKWAKVFIFNCLHHSAENIFFCDLGDKKYLIFTSMDKSLRHTMKLKRTFKTVKLKTRQN